MINGNIDYDFDEVISYIRSQGITPVENLATQINKIGEDLTDMHASFHAQKLDSAVGKIYKGFSTIIGNRNNGLIKLDLAAANIINICYNEAMRDKRILENFSDGESLNNEEVSDTSPSSTSNTSATTATAETQPTIQSSPDAPAPQPEPSISSSAGSANSTVAAQTLNVSPEELDIIKAVIRQEAGNNPAEIANVASCIKNRMDAGNWGGTNAYDVVTAKSQFSAYGGGAYQQYTNGNYYQGDEATAAQVDATINAILTGEMPVTHNYQSFRSAGSTSYGGDQLVDGGNRYK